MSRINHQKREAVASGNKKFFDGRPCSKGHIADKFTSSHGCVICTGEKAVAWEKLNRDKNKQKKLRWYRENKNAQRDEHLWRKYKITGGQYEAMLEKQNGVCAICLCTEDNDARLSVDHCHKTGKVRGLLCNDCNLSLGRFFDDPAVIRSAAEYLERNAE